MQCQFVEQPFDELEVGAGQRRNAHDIGAMRLRGCRHGRRLLKQRQAQDVESGVLERGCVFMPPLGIAATRCGTSIGMLAARAPSMNKPDIGASAMRMPPDAEPVMPASELTDTCIGLLLNIRPPIILLDTLSFDIYL